jgi:hypothetical protein
MLCVRDKKLYICNFNADLNIFSLWKVVNEIRKGEIKKETSLEISKGSFIWERYEEIIRRRGVELWAYGKSF